MGWTENRADMRTLLDAGMVDRFREWNVIRHTMMVTKADLLYNEINEVMDSGMWPYCDDPTEVHQAFHLYILRELTGRIPTSWDHVLEIGGGYGAMAKVCRSMGYMKDYTIFDIAESVEVQQHFLAHYDRMSWNPKGFVPPKNTLGMSFWALSEIATRKRSRYIKMLKACDSYLIAFQDEFDGVDNIAYFRKHLDGEMFDIKHLPGSYYMVGAV